MMIFLSSLALADGPPPMWERCVERDLLPAYALEEVVEGLDIAVGSTSGLTDRWDRLIYRHPLCPPLYLARAGVHHAAGRPDDALADLELAAFAGPDWPEVQRALAVALHDAGGAGDVLDRAIALAPDDSLLKILRAAESPVSVRPQLLREAVDAHPDDVVVALGAVDALHEAGRPLEAIALARERQAHLRAPELGERIVELEAPFLADIPERSRRPGTFRTRPDGTEEVVVFSPKRARDALDARLRELGWNETRPIAGGTRYRTSKPIQPWVDIYDDGRIDVQKAGLVKTPKEHTLENTYMIPVISRRKMSPRRQRLLNDIWYELTVWRQAQIQVAFQEALGERLPDRLTAIWESGTPMFGDGVLETPGDRRAALLQYWSSRACSEDGDAAREVVLTFLDRVVQESPHPASAAEIAAAEEASVCPRRKLQLGPPE